MAVYVMGPTIRVNPHTSPLERSQKDSSLLGAPFHALFDCSGKAFPN